MQDAQQPVPGLREFRVRATITLVNNGCMEVPFTVYGIDEDDVRKQVTPDYIMKSVSDDWGMPIRNVTILEVRAVGRVAAADEGTRAE
jgi:hypothetical protein